MESQLQHTQGRHYDEPEILTGQHTGHHDHNEDEHRGEKKSVIKKVKERAKKLKNTITKHGHGRHQHDDEHQHEEDDDDEEEEEEDDDETVEDPDVHGAPMYDSDAILTPPSGNLERPSVIAEDRYTKPVASHGPPLTVPAGADGTNLSGQSGLGDQQHQVYGQEVNPEKMRSKIGQPTGMEEEVPFAPNPARVPTPVTEHTYGTKHAFDPFENSGQDGTHGGLKSSIGKSTGMMKVPHAPSGLGSGSGSGSDPANDETKVTNPTHTGGKEAGLSQMQHSFDKMGIHDSGSERKRFDPELPENLPRHTLAGNQSTQSSSYTEKISSTASAIAEKAAVAKDVIASKLGYSGEHPTKAESHENIKNSGSTATDYAHKITDKVTKTLAPVYVKVVDAGSPVMSKVKGTVFGTGSGSGAGTGHQQMHGTETLKGTDKGVSVKEGNEDKAHAIHRGNQEESEKKSGEDRPMGRVTETLAPVYEKVFDAGSSVMSKVQGTVFGTGSGNGAGTGHQQMHGTKTVKGTDKGVSVKEGDEDKAHAIHRGNQEKSEKKSGEDRPVGRVTESVEVRSRMGTDGHEEQQQQSGNVSANKIVTEE